MNNWQERRENKRRLGRNKSNRWIWAIATLWFSSPVIFGSLHGALSGAIAQSAAPETPQPETNTPRLLKVQFEISKPEDLKVQQGDTVEVGQILAERQAEREKLLAEERALKASLEKLSLPTVPLVPPKPAPPTPQLPDRQFAEEEAAITNATLKVKEIERKISLQERKLDVLSQIQDEAGQGDLPAGAIVHEQQKLAQLQQELEIAKSNEALAIARLEKAKNAREYEEYRHQLTLARRIEEENQARLNFQRQLQEQQNEERRREIQKTELRAKLNEIQTKLEETAAVRSKYAGTIRRIKFGNQRNNLMAVELVIAVSSSQPALKETSPTDTRPNNNSSTPFNTKPFTTPPTVIEIE